MCESLVRKKDAGDEGIVTAVFFFFFSKKLRKIMPVKMFYNAMSCQNMTTKLQLKQKPHQNKIPKRIFGQF